MSRLCCRLGASAWTAGPLQNCCCQEVLWSTKCFCTLPAPTRPAKISSWLLQPSLWFSTSTRPDGSRDYFALFGLTAGFDIDAKQLDSSYKDLQQQFHPDRHATASQADQDVAADQSALVNQAYTTLKSPLQRAKYVLEQAGHGAAGNGEGTIEDPALLMKVMEAREEIDSATDAGQLQELRQDNLRQQDACSQALSTAFRTKDWKQAIELTTELRYITRISEAIMKKL